MPTHIHIARGTAAEWTADNTLLLDGEIGYETDTYKAKLGDGVTNWNDLDYWDLGLGVSALFDAVTVLTGDVSTVDTDLTAEIAARIAGDNLRQLISGKDVAGGYAGLDGSGKVLSSVLPAIAITDTFVVGSQAAMLALTAEVGDVAVRTDQNKSYILKTAGPTVLANWQELLSPTDAVLSVNGQTGIVSLLTTHIGEGTNLYFTTARVLATALTGYVVAANISLVATDTVLQAFQKLQGQVSARLPLAGGFLTAGGYIGYPSLAAFPGVGPASGFQLWADNVNNPMFRFPGAGYIAKLQFAGITASRNYSFQDATGTIAFLSDIPSVPPAYDPGYTEMILRLSQSGTDAPTYAVMKNTTNFNVNHTTYESPGKFKLVMDTDLETESTMIEPHNFINYRSNRGVSVHASCNEDVQAEIDIFLLDMKPDPDYIDDTRHVFTITIRKFA